MINDGKELNTKHVKSYWVKEYPSGIICLMFNTHKRWIEFSQQNDETYEFGPDDETGEVIEIPPFFAEGKEGGYIIADHQCKDQIVYYYIPFHLLQEEGI